MPGPQTRWHLSANYPPVGLTIIGWCDATKTGLLMTRANTSLPWRTADGRTFEPRLWKEAP